MGEAVRLGPEEAPGCCQCCCQSCCQCCCQSWQWHECRSGEESAHWQELGREEEEEGGNESPDDSGKGSNRWCGTSSATQLVTGCAIDSHSFFPEDVARFAGLMVYCFDTEDAATAASNFIKGGKPDAVEGQR